MLRLGMPSAPGDSGDCLNAKDELCPYCGRAWATVLQEQDTGLDAALTVAHAVWHFAGVP